MSELRSIKNRINAVKMNRGWQWLLYFDVVLPGVLLLLALLPVDGLRQSMARIYHTYTLYIMSPVPNLASFTGVLGLLVHGAAVLLALLRRDWKDALICLGFAGAAAAFFLVQADGVALNYLVVRLLDFGA